MLRGKVKWFNERKGFGFIVPENGPDIFVHYSVIDSQNSYKTLRDQEDVDYEAQETSRGLQATFVRSLRTV